MHIDREQKSAKDMDLRSIDDRSTAQIVPIGEGKFGVIWNGELRPEKYPAKGIAYMAIAALRRHEVAPDRSGGRDIAVPTSS